MYAESERRELSYRPCDGQRQRRVTIRSLGNYAGLSAGQGNYEEAEALMKRCITLSDELLNGEHDEAHANSVFNLAQFYIARHRPVEARPLLESLLQPGQRFPQHLTIKEVRVLHCGCANSSGIQ